MRVAYVIADHKTPHLAEAARRSILRHHPARVVLIEVVDADGLGYSEALNLGAARTRAASGAPDVWCFLNADVEMLESDEAVLDLFRLDADLAIVGPRQVDGAGLVAHGGIVPHEDGTVWDLDLRHRCWGWEMLGPPSGEPGRISRERLTGRAEELTSGTFEVPMVPGSVFYVRDGALQELGGWPEWTRFYYEDAWLCYLARHRGWGVLYTGSVTWLHYGQRAPVRPSWRQLRMAEARRAFIERCAAECIPLRQYPPDEEAA